MNKKFIIIGSIIALAAAFAFGRWSAPEKVRIETKVVTVEKKTEDQDKQVDTDRNRHKKTTTTETIKPDGTKVITTVTTDDTSTNQKSDTKTDIKDQINQTASQTTEVTRGTAKVSILALGGLSISSFSSPLYGASVSKPILGPITVGVWGLSNATAGVAVGLTF